MATIELTIDESFKELIPRLQREEYSLLEANIMRDGCRDPLVVWDGILVDGHNRFEICCVHDIPFEVREIEFPDRQAATFWIIDNQIGRRNLADIDRINVRKKLADAAGVGERTFDAGKAILEAAENGEIDQSEVDAIRRKEKSISGVAKELKKKQRSQSANGKASKSSSNSKSPDPPKRLTVSRETQAAQKDRESFHEIVKLVCGNGIYTLKMLARMKGLSVATAAWFVRTCEVSPHVEVLRSFGKGGLVQFQFRMIGEYDDVWKNVEAVLTRIGQRPDSSEHDRLDAELVASIINK